MSLIRRVILIGLGLAILLLGIVFSLHNSQMISLDFLIYETPEFYLSFWLICSFVLGGVLGVLACSTTIIKLRALERRSTRKIKRSESEINRLKGESA